MAYNWVNRNIFKFNTNIPCVKYFCLKIWKRLMEKCNNNILHIKVVDSSNLELSYEEKYMNEQLINEVPYIN
jgi:hypothetical protein